MAHFKDPGTDAYQDKAKALMRELGLQPQDMSYCFERMRLHAQANDRRQRDWDASYHNWVRKAVNDREIGPNSKAGADAGSAFPDA